MKITTTLAVVLALAAFGCGKKEEEGTVRKELPATTPKPTEAPKVEAPKPMTGAELAAKYQACVGMVNDAKWDEFKKDCIAEGYTHHSVAGMPETKGSDAVIGWLKDMKAAMADRKLQPQLVMVSGRNILAVNLVTGTHTGPIKHAGGEIPATNKKIGHLMLHRLKLDDANKATDEWVWADAMTMMGQLGLAPKGSPATRPVLEKGWDGAPIVVVTADDAKEKANIEAVKKGNDAFIANKPADAMAMMTDDAVESDLSMEKDVTGKKEIEKGFVTFRNAWSDVKMSNVEMWAAGDYVVQTFKFEGKHDKDLGKIKKTGKTVGIDIAEVIHMKDGKATHVWRFLNGMQFAEQLGLMPPPGAAPAGAAPKAGEAPKAEEPAKK
jgi:predicted ester cyclase